MHRSTFVAAAMVSMVLLAPRARADDAPAPPPTPEPAPPAPDAPPPAPDAPPPADAPPTPTPDAAPTPTPAPSTAAPDDAPAPKADLTPEPESPSTPAFQMRWRDHDTKKVLLWGAQLGFQPTFGGRQPAPLNLQPGIVERFDSCSFDDLCVNFSGLGPAWGVAFLGALTYDIATDDSNYKAMNGILGLFGNNPFIDTDMGWMFGVTDQLGLGAAIFTQLLGTELSQDVALEGKFGLAGTAMYTGLPVLVRGRLFVAIAVEGEGGSVSALAQGGNVNVYFHLLDGLPADIGPFVTAGYEVDITKNVVYDLNAGVGFSFL